MTNTDEKYVKALEEELQASFEREKKLSNDNLSFAGFVGKKIKKTGLYKNIISNPDSKAGKMIRAPRTLVRMLRHPEVRKELSQKKTVKSEFEFEFLGQHLLEPWMIDFEERKKIALDAIKNGKKLALYYVEKPDASTFRYRCYNTFEITKESKKWQAVYFFKKEVDEVEKLLPKASLLVFGRQSGQEKIIGRLTEIAHKNKIKVGLDIDDLVFNLDYLDVVLDTINGNTNRGYWVTYFASVKAMAEGMDFYIATNDFLADKLKESFNKPCKNIRNSMNKGQLTASEVYLTRKEKSDKFRVGYFSGSPTHAKDFAVAEPGLLKFLQAHEDAELHVVGYMRFSKAMEKLIKAKRIKFLPMMDFRKLQRAMSEVDVNIAPLVVNDFTNCKSELKFFEAAAVETTTIASPTYTFKNAISDGKNGFLAEPDEWYEKLEYLYNHPAENKKIAKVAREYAIENYTGKEFLKEVEEAYDYFAK